MDNIAAEDINAPAAASDELIQAENEAVEQSMTAPAGKLALDSLA